MKNGARGLGLGELSKIWRFSINIYTTAEASDFKFGTQLWFANSHNKITPIAKWDLRFPFNMCATAETNNFEFGTRLGFAKAHHKIPHRRKRGRGPRLKELPQILGFPFNISATAEASKEQLRIWHVQRFSQACFRGKTLQVAICSTGHTLLLEYKKKPFIPDMRF